jgi:hypothetical protein
VERVLGFPASALTFIHSRIEAIFGTTYTFQSRLKVPDYFLLQKYVFGIKLCFISKVIFYYNNFGPSEPTYIQD